MRFFRHILFFILVAVSADRGFAQNRPIGYWRSHLPYSNALGLATNGNSVYTICNQAFFIYDPLNNGATIPYSKVEGMSDIGMQCIAYDVATATTILVYANGNIDLFREKEHTFYNIPDLKIKSLSGSKTVNQVYAENGMAYICTSIGILVLDLVSHNIDENYKFYINNQILPVQGFTRNGEYFYAITSNGLYRANRNNPQLQNFQVWALMDTIKTYRNIVSLGKKLFLSDQKSVYSIINDTVRSVYTCTDTNNALVQHIDAGNSTLLISEFYSSVYRGAVKFMDVNFNIVDSYDHKIGNPLQAIQLLDNSTWIADQYNGLQKIEKAAIEGHSPPGPSGIGAFDIYAYNKDLWVAHGGFSDEYAAVASMHGVSNFKNEEWELYVRYIYPPFNNMDAFVALTRDESTGTMYMGSFLNGLFILKKDGTYEALNKNSIFDTSTAYFGQDQRQIVGLAVDESRNLWAATAYSRSQLYAKDPDGNWFKFYIPGVPSAGPLATDGHGQVWFVGYGSQGIVAFNPNGTLSDPSDDAFYHFTAGVGSGNLPSNKVYCIARDKNNNIWVGTDNGIGIISNCVAEKTSAICDAQIPIVQYDQFAGYLFAGNNVRTIAVDGANRKWIGTDDGVWLLSPSADRIMYRFTADNSPLPSDHVRKITIDPVTGDVYMGTDAGLVSYRSTAIDAEVADAKAQIFPNPVDHTYSGTIAIKGLAANSDVRITDIDGKLVYSTKAFGGQAVWNGMDYTGHRPQSGVYLVFASTGDGGQTYTGKIVFMK